MDKSHEFDIKLKMALEIFLQKKLSSLPDIKDLDKSYNFSNEFEENIKKLYPYTEGQVPE